MTATAAAGAEQPFNRRTLFWGILASMFAAAGFFLLSTYAPDFRLGREGGPTPLAKGGTGFAGLYELLEGQGFDIWLAFDTDDLSDDTLLIATIAPDSSIDALKEMIEVRKGMPTLYVLPKWQTIPMEEHPGWERQTGRLDAYAVNAWLGRIAKGAVIGAEKAAPAEMRIGKVTVAAPEDIQWAKASPALIEAGDGKAVLFEVRDQPKHYVLTEPDLLNNAGMKDLARAAAAVQLVDMLGKNDDGDDDRYLMFDLTLHGAGRKHDLSKLLVEPPFLALTLAVLATAALAFAHGLGRFGPPLGETRAIPFGKRALVETTAVLLKRAGRLGNLGGRYAALMRARAAALLGAPPGLQGEALDRWLDSRDKNGAHGFATRARAAADAADESAVSISARELHDWIAGRLSDRR